ncbi:hypothetical protein OSB04_016640 [Centaurea solstitialis]|uniref:DUF4378 domain-containing protein n=1 Tax=Centaurea solstitialis TaxID=347529 RepID=A0AA38TD81_9ASTR|nr:hypothetical protein OSB04_016640 [Centaurea solstitialis]
MEVEKRSSKGGFLQLFDWNVKSRKKLFSNKPDLPESSKHGKENLDNLAISRLQQMELDEALHGPSLTGGDWASSMSNDEGCGTKAPGVVARLMGLDSLPTLDVSDPGFTPFIDSHSFRHSLHPRTTTEFESGHQFAGMRNKLDGFSRNPVEDRLQKLQNRPIERFQSEVLPPRSAKSVPITHVHRMLSPIKSPGFILSRNAAYIMEAASKMIEQSPHSTLSGRLPSSGSSSVPIRIKDLKEKMEAAHRTSRISETSQRPKVHNSPASSSKLQPPDKRQCRSEVVILKHGVAGNLKQKNKSVSLTTTSAKPNIQKGEGPTSSYNTRSNMKQKEDDVKSVQLDKKQRSTPKRVQNRSKTPRTPEVLTQNNQKQNRASQKDRSSLKPRVPCQPDRKATSTNGFCREVKTSKKAVESSAIGARKIQSATYEAGKEFSLTKTKNFSGKKRLTDGEVGFDGTATAANNVQKKEKERSVKCNITIDGSSNWESVDRKNGMDVVSFTFTSPIKKPVAESEPSRQSPVKSRGLCLNFDDDQPDTGTSEFPTFRTPMIDSDALSALLEQKLKELSSIVETSQCDSVREDSVNSASAKHEKMFHLNMQKDKSMIQHDSDASSAEQMLAKAKLDWQGMEVSECNTNSETEESGISHGYQQHPCTLYSLETDDSCITSSTATLTSNGNKQCTSTRSMELLAEEIELQDSATSLPNTIFEFTSTERWSSQWEFDYIKELLIHAELVLEDLSFSHTQKVINAHLFDQLENQKRNMDPFLKVQRKALFDCVSACLESRRDRASGGSYEEWAKWSMIFRRKDLLADEIQKEISGWTSMEDLMVDEVVDKDMSTRDGKWLDFEAEALEEGVVVENAILTTLIDEMVTDFLCF